jgi:hypothetical protein
MRRIWVWAFRDPWLVWLTFGTLAVALLVVWWWETEPAFRSVGIRNTRALFGRPSMRKRFVEWWRRRPRRGHTVSALAGIGMEHSSATADAEMWSETSPDDYIEVRLSALEKNLLDVRGRFNAFVHQTRTELSKHTDNLRQEAQVRDDEDKAIRIKVEETGVGGLDISMVGVAWIGVGVFLSSMSPSFAAPNAATPAGFSACVHPEHVNGLHSV